MTDWQGFTKMVTIAAGAGAVRQRLILIAAAVHVSQL
jgi:hypothetical protein